MSEGRSREGSRERYRYRIHTFAGAKPRESLEGEDDRDREQCLCFPINAARSRRGSSANLWALNNNHIHNYSSFSPSAPDSLCVGLYALHGHYSRARWRRRRRSVCGAVNTSTQYHTTFAAKRLEIETCARHCGLTAAVESGFLAARYRDGAQFPIPSLALFER